MRPSDIRTGTDEHHAAAAERVTLGDGCRERCGAGRFDEQVLVIEQGSAIKDQLEEAFDGVEGRLFVASNLGEAETILNDNDVDLILIGLFEQTESVGALLNKLNGAGRAAATPIVRIESADLEDQRADHLVGYIREHLSRNASTE